MNSSVGSPNSKSSPIALSKKSPNTAREKKPKSWKCSKDSLALWVSRCYRIIMPNPPFNIPPDKLPRHVAIIMDGNGRWALSRGKPRLAGHKAGTENLRRVIRATVEFGVKYLTIYAFSTENWGRPPEEVQGLMYILEDVIDRELKELHQEG